MIILIGSMFFLFGSVISLFAFAFLLFKNMDSATAKLQSEQAKELAKEHIKNKYNFDLEIVNSTTNMEHGPIGVKGDYSTTIIEAKHESRSYYIKVQIEPYGKTVGDTYQNKEIVEGFVNNLEMLFGEKPYYFYSNLEDDSTKGRQYFSNKFNGSNTQSFSYVSFVAVFINNDNFNNQTVESYKKSFVPQEAHIYNFNSLEDYKKVEKEVNKVIRDGEDSITSTKSDLPIIYLRDYLDNPYGSTETLYSVNLETNTNVIFAKKDFKTNTISSDNNYKKQSLSNKGVTFIKEKFGSNKKVLESYNVGNNQMADYVFYIKKNNYNNKDMKALLYCSYNEYYGDNIFKESDVEAAGDYLYSKFESGLYCTDDLYYVVIGE
jgi:hypothetical protein